MPISLEKLTDKDIGRLVFYTSKGREIKKERGRISRFNTMYVHVLYDGDTHTKATRPDDLSW